MLDLFPVPWANLDLDALGSFLRHAESEPLQWEAKGTEIRPEHVTKPAGAFANSVDGGFLILGATQDKSKDRAEQWTLDGATFADEPELWISNVIATGLRPRPAVRFRTFKCNDDRYVVVVWVPPVDVAPCLVGGTVLERLPGSTVTVKDPQRLADLYGRGKAALTRARTVARDRSETLLEDALERAHHERTSKSIDAGMALPRFAGSLGRGGNQVRVVVGLCPVSVAEDPGAWLFTQEFATAMQQAMRLHSARGGYGIEHPSLHQSQTSMSSGAGGLGGIRWHLEAWSDGSVGAVFEESEDDGTAAGIRTHLHQAWALADDFARRLRGGDEHFVTFRVTGVARLDYSRGSSAVPAIRRGLIRLPELGSPTFDHVYRELQRIGNEFAWEPKPDAG